MARFRTCTCHLPVSSQFADSLYGALPGDRWAAVSHELIQLPLRLFPVIRISDFQHLAFVSDHVVDCDGVVPAVIRTVVIDTTDILGLAR